MVIDGNGNVAVHTAASPGYAFTVVDGASIDRLTLGNPLAISSGGTGAATTSQGFAFMGPVSGSGAPSFRALVPGDLPSNIYSNGSGLNSLNASNISFGAITANQVASIQGNITSLGTLTSLTINGTVGVTGNIYASNAISTTNIFANTITLSNATSTINVTGNIYASNAISTTNIFANTITLSNATSTINVTGNIYASNAVSTTNIFANTITLSNATSTINVTGNIFASNAVSTTNIFANTITLSNATSTINVTGNIYASNAITTNNLYTAGFTSNATNTNFLFDTLTIPFIYSTTANVAGTSNIFNLVAPTITSTNVSASFLSAGGFTIVAGGPTVGVTGNIFASNALSTTNVLGTRFSAGGFALTAAGPTVGVTGNIFASNAVSTTNIFATGNVAIGQNITALQANVHIEQASLFIGNSASVGSVSNTNSITPYRLVFDNTANTSIIPNKIQLYSDGTGQVCGLSTSGTGGVAGIVYQARSFHSFTTGAPASTPQFSIATSGSCSFTGSTLNIGGAGQLAARCAIQAPASGLGTTNVSLRIESSNICMTTGPSLAGFGTTAPAANLHVVGNIYTTTSITSNLVSTGTAAPTIVAAATIAPVTGIVFVSTSATPIVNITAPFPISTNGGQITLIPTGAFTTTAAGNIALPSTAVISRPLIMTYDSVTSKWYPSY